MNYTNEMVSDWICYAKAHPTALKIQDLLQVDPVSVCNFIGDVLEVDTSDEVVNEVALGLIEDGCRLHGDFFLAQLRKISLENEALEKCLNEFLEFRNN